MILAPLLINTRQFSREVRLYIFMTLKNNYPIYLFPIPWKIQKHYYLAGLCKSPSCSASIASPKIIDQVSDHDCLNNIQLMKTSPKSSWGENPKGPEDQLSLSWAQSITSLLKGRILTNKKWLKKHWIYVREFVRKFPQVPLATAFPLLEYLFWYAVGNSLREAETLKKRSFMYSVRSLERWQILQCRFTYISFMPRSQPFS